MGPMRKIHILLVVLLFFLPLSLRAGERQNNKKILVICTHAESSEWAQDMLLPIRQLGAERKDIHIETCFLRITSLSSVEDLMVKEMAIFADYPEAPDMVILVGGSSYGIADELNERWPGIPMILAGEHDYYCDDSYAIGGKADPKARRTLVFSMREHGLNVTLVHAPAMVEQTVDLMFTVQPQIRKFIFIAGENFQSKEQQICLERHLTNKYPSIEYQPLFSTDHTTDELIEILKKEPNNTTGVLFGSWLSHQDYKETVTSRHNVTHIIESVCPVFTTLKCNLEHAPGIIGYYSYDHDQYYSIMRQRIEAVIDDGFNPKDLPFIHVEVGRPTLNWKAMEQYGLDTSLIPEQAEIIGKPHTMWEAHKPTIMWAAFFALVSFGLFVFFVMKRSQKALRKARDIAEKANKMKAAFVQNISHEVRTPLNAITGFSQLLCLPDGYNTEAEKAEYMGYVSNNANLLTVIINDMLSLSDVENGKYQINNSPCNLNDMARMALKSIEHRLPPGVELIRKNGLPEELRFNTDGLRVQQVLLNLLTNACKYTKEGSITLESSIVENPGYVTFSVSDTGPGVPPEKAKEIFERFVKLDEHVQGAGLGLSICKIIVANIGGDIWLDTSYSGGARFVFTVPFS